MSRAVFLRQCAGERGYPRRNAYRFRERAFLRHCFLIREYHGEIFSPERLSFPAHCSSTQNWYRFSLRICFPFRSAACCWLIIPSKNFLSFSALFMDTIKQDSAPKIKIQQNFAALPTTSCQQKQGILRPRRKSAQLSLRHEMNNSARIPHNRHLSEYVSAENGELNEALL